MDKGKNVAESSNTYYQHDVYEDGITQTLSFKPDVYQKIREDKEKLTIGKIFKTKWFERNKEVRYIAQKHENIIDITTSNGKAKINLITDHSIRRELSKLNSKEASKYKNIYIGAIEFTIKAYFQKNIDTPVQIYIMDDRILNNIPDALIAVVKGNLIYQKLKFTVQPDFSVALSDERKELALTLYYKLAGIDMPPGCKVMSIETKVLYALTGNHIIRKQSEKNVLVPKLYDDILEKIEHKNNSSITIPEEISIDFGKCKKSLVEQMKPRVEGTRLSFRKEIPQLNQLRMLNLIIPMKKIKINVKLYKGMRLEDNIVEIHTEATNSFININMINEDECEPINEPITCKNLNDERDIIITKSTNLRFKIQDLDYKINIGVIEYESSYKFVLGKDFLNLIDYRITNKEIIITDQDRIRSVRWI